MLVDLSTCICVMYDSHCHLYICLCSVCVHLYVCLYALHVTFCCVCLCMSHCPCGPLKAPLYLLLQANSILPGEMYKGVHCLPEIVAAAMDFENHEHRK